MVTEKKIDKEGPCFAHLKARKSGLLGSALTFDLYADCISVNETKVSGEFTEITPISKISNFGYGYMKPIISLIIGIIVIIFTLLNSLQQMNSEGAIFILVAGLLIASVFFIAYASIKCLCIYWHTVDGTRHIIVLKKVRMYLLLLLKKTQMRFVLSCASCLKKTISKSPFLNKPEFPVLRRAFVSMWASHGRTCRWKCLFLP